jgi:hypothetical protein
MDYDNLPLFFTMGKVQWVARHTKNAGRDSSPHITPFILKLLPPWGLYPMQGDLFISSNGYLFPSISGSWHNL